MPPWLDIVSALLGGGLLTILVQSRMRRATTSDIESKVQREYFDDLRRTRTDLIACEDRIRERDDRLRNMTTEVSVLQSRLRRAPMARLADHLEELNGLRKFFDVLTDPIIVSTSENGGTFIYANDAFCKMLEYTCDEIIAMGWRGLVAPEDLKETIEVETSAWDDPVWGFVNTYISKSGRRVVCRWFCRAYRRSLTIAKVEMRYERPSA